MSEFRSYHFYEELKNNYFQFLLSGEYHIRYQIRISIFRYNYDTRYGQQKVVSQTVLKYAQQRVGRYSSTFRYSRYLIDTGITVLVLTQYWYTVN